MESLGLAGSAYGLFGRRYTGELEGRSVEVCYSPAYALNAARVDVYVEAKLGARMAVGRQRPLLDCRDCPRLDLGEGVGYAIYARDEPAALRLLADPEVRAALDRLMQVREVPALYVQPERLWLRVQPWRSAVPSRDVGQEVEGWLRDLLLLASG
jgi:hypothetical protein